MVRCAIYRRVSSTKQSTEGTSLETQEQECSGEIRASKNALQYEASRQPRDPQQRLTFCLQIYVFGSGAEGIRTPDLRRAKADCPNPILSHYVSLPSLFTRFLVSPKRLSSHCVPSRTGPVAVRLQYSLLSRIDGGGQPTRSAWTAITCPLS